MMHGVAWFKLHPASQNFCTAVYTDGTEESAHISATLRGQFEAYHRYQESDGPASEPPKSFALVSEIQAARRAAI